MTSELRRSTEVGASRKIAREDLTHLDIISKITALSGIIRGLKGLVTQYSRVQNKLVNMSDEDIENKKIILDQVTEIYHRISNNYHNNCMREVTAIERLIKQQHISDQTILNLFEHEKERIRDLKANNPDLLSKIEKNNQ